MSDLFHRACVAYRRRFGVDADDVTQDRDELQRRIKAVREAAR